MDNYNEPYIGESEVFQDFLRRLSAAAPVNRSVLLIGERGSGKEIAAKRLHYLSGRWQKNLVTVNLAALTPTLIESELFGYESGAFTGAKASRAGRFEEAQGGTLFLDEVALIPMSVQEKILRVVEYGTYERVGSAETREADVRIVAATNADLRDLCRKGLFKQDLLDRLSFEVIYVPPLRKRPEDIMLLANFFAAKMALECKRPEMPHFSEKAVKCLLSYPWPGNVRELKNTVERAVYKSQGSEIDCIVTDPFTNPFSDEPEKAEVKKEEINLFSVSLPQAREELERKYLAEALEKSGHNQRKAAALMGISYDSFRGLYRKYFKVI
ncbi:MAG: sigma 54-interacting transcriptional regulator [Sphaerochaetaceae bacterium]|nr:sigma 54-interacting transcriptional regulator [Sphaerochaetaceae bacterium]